MAGVLMLPDVEDDMNPLPHEYTVSAVAADMGDVETHASGLPSRADPASARRALEKAERGCLISNSLKAPAHVVADVDLAEPEYAGQGAAPSIG
jgi:hypothetical protein